MPLKILALSNQTQGTNDYAFVRAFRRLGHSVTVADHNHYIPPWRAGKLRVLRRLLTPLLVKEYNLAILKEAEQLKPDLLFVFKGPYLSVDTLKMIKSKGTIAIQFFPDTGFADHGPYLPKSISYYDWVFTTKPSGVDDLRSNYKQPNASYKSHGFDPEVHVPVEVSQADEKKYGCEVSFIGQISPKKLAVLESLHKLLPALDIKIWGPNGWSKVDSLAKCYQGSEVWGREYAKAIQESRINLGLLFEGGDSAPQPDLITSRTFHIPATGGFMLHERTDEVTKYFEEDKECCLFSDVNELAKKISYYLKHVNEREKIANAGRERCIKSGYSIENRAECVLGKYEKIRGARQREQTGIGHSQQ